MSESGEYRIECQTCDGQGHDEIGNLCLHCSGKGFETVSEDTFYNDSPDGLFRFEEEGLPG